MDWRIQKRKRAARDERFLASDAEAPGNRIRAGGLVNNYSKSTKIHPSSTRALKHGWTMRGLI